jgi:hypothetical protein
MTSLLYAFTQHPEKVTGREKIRHFVDQENRTRTLCGRPIAWLFDYGTPLAFDCKQCAVQARTRDAAVRRNT